jgi:hypothetical protein
LFQLEEPEPYELEPEPYELIPELIVYAGAAAEELMLPEPEPEP